MTTRGCELQDWWISLGITPELIEPGKPQQNGRHERMHRTLKEDATLPPRANLRAQQSCFNEFRRVYSHDRPHEALNMETPSMPTRPRRGLSPAGPVLSSTRLTSSFAASPGGCTLRWKSRKVFVSSLLKHDFVGLEQIAEDVWSVFYGPVHLGWLDEADYRIMDVKERSRRTRWNCKPSAKYVL